MSGLAFLFACATVFWLILWAVSDPANRSSGWWPFDLDCEDAGRPASTRSERSDTELRQETGAASAVPPWRRRAAETRSKVAIARRDDTGRNRSTPSPVTRRREQKPPPPWRR